MGRFSLLGMIEMAGEEIALAWHLESNTYPPLPKAFVPFAQQAIEAIRADDRDRPIPMPEGYLYSPPGTAPKAEMTASAIVDALNLEAFFEGEGDGVEA